MATGRRGRRGQAMVEMTFALPIFLLLVFGLIEGSRLVYSYAVLHHAAQEGGRVAVLAINPATGTAMDEATVKTKVVGAAEPLTVTAENVEIDVKGSGSPTEKDISEKALGDRVQVTVRYTFTPVVATFLGWDATIPLVGQAELMVE